MNSMKKCMYVIAIGVIIYLGWEFFRPRAGEMQSQTRTVGAVASIIDSFGAGTESAPIEGPVTAVPVSVTYSAEGFSPREVMVKKGGAVMWTNASPSGMQVASDGHPAHTGYDGTSRKEHCADGALASFDECVTATAGGQWSFTFNSVGTWKYHNHANEIFGGTVTVTE